MNDRVDKSFRRRLAERDDDSTKWTVRDALEDALAEIGDDEAVDCVAIHYYRTSPDGSLTPHYVCAGMTLERHVGLLEMAKLGVIKDWTS